MARAKEKTPPRTPLTSPNFRIHPVNKYCGSASQRTGAGLRLALLRLGSALEPSTTLATRGQGKVERWDLGELEGRVKGGGLARGPRERGGH